MWPKQVVSGPRITDNLHVGVVGLTFNSLQFCRLDAHVYTHATTTEPYLHSHWQCRNPSSNLQGRPRPSLAGLRLVYLCANCLPSPALGPPQEGVGASSPVRDSYVGHKLNVKKVPLATTKMIKCMYRSSK